MNWISRRFELSRGGERSNVKAMEGLRGLAIFLVFLVHYVAFAKPWVPIDSATLPVAEAMQAIGNSGVDLFFVLSGYLIYGSLIGRKQDHLSYAFKRIRRIYPTFTVVFAIYLCLSFVFRSESKLPAEWPNALLYLTQNFLLLPGLFPIKPMILVAWSLSYEMFYYLAVPVMIEVFRLREHTTRWRITFFVATTILVGACCAVFQGPIRMIMFLSGILLFEALSAWRSTGEDFSFIGLLALVTGLFGVLLPSSGPSGEAARTVILFVAFFVSCLACFKSTTGWFAGLFSWKPLRWLGNMSYSYYLIHGLILKAAFMVLSALLPGAALGAWFFWLLLPLMFAVTIPAAVGLFLAVERPFSLSPSTERSLAPGTLPGKA